ncbi:MAG: ribonuclease III [Clostridia bacterium]|nr:ribonuclease III [Clostridia bacterium]
MSGDISSNDLAYLGDAVIELFTRRFLVTCGTDGKHHSESAIEFVCAAAQSDALSKVESLFTEEEADVYRRARNNYHTSNIPKSASALQYRRSTGFEAVFGYLYLKGDVPRAKELFEAAYGEIINKVKGN